MARECPKCSARLPGLARYCPRCGTSADTPAEDVLTLRRARREIVVGWILFIVGGGMCLATLLGMARSGWITFGLGITAVVIGLGCLVGETDAEKRRKKKKQRRSDDGRANDQSAGKAASKDDGSSTN